MDYIRKFFGKNQQKNVKKKEKEEVEGTALDNFRATINFLNKCAWYSGIKYVDDWKLSLVSTWDAWASVFFFAAFMWYTIIFVHSTDNIALIGGLAFNFTVWNKMITVIRNHKKFMSLLNFVFKVIEINNDHPEREGILRGVSKTVKWHVNFNVIGVCAGIAVFSVVPTYDCLVHRKLTPVSSMVTPFTKDGSIVSYLINSFFNVLFCLYGLSFGVSVTSMFFFFVDMYNGMVLILKHELTQFDELNKSNDKNQSFDKPFRNIMLMLQDLARYGYEQKFHGSKQGISQAQ